MSTIKESKSMASIKSERRQSSSTRSSSHLSYREPLIKQVLEVVQATHQCRVFFLTRSIAKFQLAAQQEIITSARMIERSSSRKKYEKPCANIYATMAISTTKLVVQVLPTAAHSFNLRPRKSPRREPSRLKPATADQARSNESVTGHHLKPSKTQILTSKTSKMAKIEAVTLASSPTAPS